MGFMPILAWTMIGRVYETAVPGEAGRLLAIGLAIGVDNTVELVCADRRVGGSGSG